MAKNLAKKASVGVMNQCMVPRHTTITSRLSWAMQDMLPDTMHRSTKAFIWSIPVCLSVVAFDYIGSTVSPRTLAPEWREASKERRRAQQMDPYYDVASTIKIPNVPSQREGVDPLDMITEIQPDTAVGKEYATRRRRDKYFKRARELKHARDWGYISPEEYDEIMDLNQAQLKEMAANEDDE